MNQKKHVPFSEQKMDQQHDQHIKLKKNGTNQFASTLDFKYRNLLLWIPVFVGLAFLAFGIVREQMKKDEKMYCYKGGYIPTGFKFPFPENSPRELLVNTRYSFQIYVDSYDHAISKKIAQSGSYQPSYINLIGHVVRNGDNVLIAGAHLGLEAVVMGKIVGDSGRVFVLASTQFMYELTKKNINLNQLDKTTSVQKYEPSDTQQQTTIQVISGLNKSQTQTQFSYQTQKIKRETIDKNFPKQTQLNFAYINVDNQGVKALMGMREVIQRSPQLVIMVKWQVSKFQNVDDGEVRNVLEFMAKHGYKSYTYKGGSYKQSCTVGQFLYQGDIQRLINIRQQMIIFFPENYSLPR